MVFLGNARQRGGAILIIVLSGTSLALIAWVAWNALAALFIYGSAMLAATALIFWSVRAEQDHESANERRDREDGTDT